MTRIPFEEALDAGPVVLAWRGTAPEPGQRTLSVFSLAGGGAEQVAWRRFPEAEVDDVTARYVAGGHRVGHYTDGADIVWVVDERGVAVWSEQRLELSTVDGALQTDGGPRVDPEQVETLVLFVSPDRAERGIRARLSDGQEVDLVVDVRWGATLHPLYNRDDLVFETWWAVELGQALCHWADTGYDDQI